jgi:hypothetical protein
MRFSGLKTRLQKLEQTGGSRDVVLTFLDGSTRVIAWRNKNHLDVLTAAMRRLGEPGAPSESKFDLILDLIANAIDFDTGKYSDNFFHVVWGLAVEAKHRRDCNLADFYDLDHCGPQCVYKQVRSKEMDRRENVQIETLTTLN